MAETRSSAIFHRLKPLSKYLYTYHFRNSVWNNYFDNDFIYEFARVTHSLSLFTTSMTQEQVNKAVYTCDRVNKNKEDSDLECVLSLTLALWHYQWKQYNIYYAENPSEAVVNIPLQPEDTTTIYYHPTYLTAYNGMTVHDAEIAYMVDSINDIKDKLTIANALYNCNIKITSIDFCAVSSIC